MAIPVSYSKKPLFFDALPAQKVQYYTPDCINNIYTFARIYVHKEDLMLSLSVFQKEPTEQDWAVFLLHSQTQGLLTICINVHTAFMFKQQNGKTTPIPVPSIERFAGEDEQGWYWSAGLCINKELLQEIDCPLKPHQTFYGGVLYCKNLDLKTLTCKEMGASFNPPSLFPDKESLNQFKIIDF